MKNIYTDRLEKILSDMEAEIQSGTSTVSLEEFNTWKEFASRIQPAEKTNTFVSYLDYSPYTKVPCYKDIREIMKLAEARNYPMWFIQPKITGPRITLSFDKGTCQMIYSVHNDDVHILEKHELNGIPDAFESFTGNIIGASSKAPTGLEFIAYDLAMDASFPDRITLLKNNRFKVVDFILFPTQKIPSVSSSTLETSLRKYVSQAQEHGHEVDGVIIASNEGIEMSSSDGTKVVLEFS
jgi:hypothetical protein